MSRYAYVIVLVLAFFACEQDFVRGPLVKDDVPPSPVSEVTVTNLPGGAKISYKVPEDSDALLVEATYKLDNGKVVTSKSSIFKNFVEVQGLRQVKPQEVELVTVDRSDNRSTSVFVTINPETAPVDKLFNSFELVEDFGGVRLNYRNGEKISAELLLYTEDENGNMVYRQSVFISDDKRSHQTFRGIPPMDTKFGVAAIDRWDNSTEILTASRTPLEEIILDLEKFRDVTLTGDEPAAFGW